MKPYISRGRKPIRADVTNELAGRKPQVLTGRLIAQRVRAELPVPVVVPIVITASAVPGPMVPILPSWTCVSCGWRGPGAEKATFIACRERQYD